MKLDPITLHDPADLSEQEWAAAAQQVADVLARTTYKPHWRFEVKSRPGLLGYGEGYLLQIIYRAPNAYRPEQVGELLAVHPIPPYLMGASEDAVVGWLFDTIMAQERHEAGEWLIVGQHRPFDPHAGPR